MRCGVRGLLAWALVAAMASAAAAQNTIAVTEFMDAPIGEEEDGREWIELFNYGDQPISLEGWQLFDDHNQICSLPKVTIQPKDFIVVVCGGHHYRTDDERKALFEKEWLGGKADARVVGSPQRFSLDGSDEIYIRNARRQPVWGVVFRGDATPGRAVFLAEEKFNLRLYGTKGKPGVNRQGNDTITAGSVLGYESNDSTADPAAYESQVQGLDFWGPGFKSAAEGGSAKPGTGSPLKGNYTGVKK